MAEEQAGRRGDAIHKSAPNEVKHVVLRREARAFQLPCLESGPEHLTVLRTLDGCQELLCGERGKEHCSDRYI